MYGFYIGMRLVRLISAYAKFPAHQVKIFLNYLESMGSFFTLFLSYLESSGSFFVSLQILNR